MQFFQKLKTQSSYASTTICVLCLLLSQQACIPLTKRSIDPIPLPDTFSISGQSLVDIRWWLAFNDKTLNQYVETALSSNFNLLAARERILQAQAVAKQSGAALIPSLDGNGSASTRRDYQSGDNSETFFFDLAASYEIDLWGRLSNMQDAALLELEATRADFATAQITLAAEVTLTWFQISEVGQQLDLLQQQKETNEKVLEVITTQFRSGKTDISDVLQQRQLVESNRGSLAKLSADKRILEYKLAILIGTPPEKSFQKIIEALPELPVLPRTGIPLLLVTRRPDVSSSFIRLQAADKRTATAVANRFPRLSLSASLTTSGNRGSDLFSDWYSTLAAGLFAPIVDGGYLRAEVDRTESVAREQLNRYSQTILEAIGEIENSLVREQELLQSLKSETIQLQLATETVEHVGNRYRQGVEDYQRVLLALISSQNLQRDIVSSRLALLSNRVSLYRALSGPIDQESTTQDKNKGGL